MKLIDADKLTEVIMRVKLNSKGAPNFATAEVIDAVEVVLCQDCKHWVYNFNGCRRNPCTEPWYATDYCNYGERKESE